MAGNKYTWSVATTKLLISHYESHEMLYNSKHKDYKNRNKRLEIYKNIADAINVIQEGCTMNDVRKKLNGLRSQYLAEKMKILNSKRSGQGSNDIYTPTTYWYPLLSFLDGSTAADKSVSNLDTLEPETQHGDFEESEEPPHEDEDPRPSTSRAETIPSDHSYILEPPAKKNNKSLYDSLLMEASKTMSKMTNMVKESPCEKEDDSLDNFGKFIVSELRDIKNASNDKIFRQTKRKIQQVVIDTWNRIDSACPDVSHTSESIPCANSFSPQSLSLSENTILSHESGDSIGNEQLTQDHVYYVTDIL